MQTDPPLSRVRSLDLADAPACDAIIASLPDWFGLDEGIRECAAAVRSEPGLVFERDGAVIGWAKAGPYADQHHYYDGVREATLYVDRAARRAGVGRVLLDALAGATAQSGAHKLVGKIFTSNEPSIALVKGLGWSEVGVHRRHGTFDGEWKDVLVVERLLAAGE